MRLPGPPPRVAPVLLDDLRRREPHPVLQTVLGAATFLLAASVGTGLVGTTLTVAVHGPPVGDATQWYAAHPFPGVAVGLLVEGVVAVGLSVVVIRRLAGRPVYELSRPGALRELGGGLALGTGIMSLVVLLTWLLGGYHVRSVGWDTGILTGLALGIGPGLAEEVAFRGILLRVLDKSLGSRGALATTAVLFGALHLTNPEATLWGAIAIASEAGILLGAAYLLTRRLWFAIGIHMAWNAVESAVFGLDVSGSGSGRGFVDARLTGPTWLSGGAIGIEGSATAVLVGLTVGLALLVAAHRRGHLRPARQRSAPVLDLRAGSGDPPTADPSAVAG